MPMARERRVCCETQYIPHSVTRFSSYMEFRDRLPGATHFPVYISNSSVSEKINRRIAIEFVLLIRYSQDRFVIRSRYL